MLSIHLKAQDEYQWLGENPSPATFPAEKDWYPLYHQWRTYNAEAPIIVNTYNTGTGKTKAGLLRLLKRARNKGFDRLRASQDNALLIAPTNELLAQHVDDAREFCKDNSLPYRVLALTKADLEECKDIPGFSEERLRRGAILHSVLNDASKVDDDTNKRATLYVVNPDIFYYALMFCYSQFDRASLFTNFFTLFNYIIIDEFHYYDPKQLATFLFFMKLSQHKGYIDSNAKKRQFCILTATPRPQVTSYVAGLAIPIEWIRPSEIEPDDMPFVKPVRALTPVQLQIYSTEELQGRATNGSLLQLVEQQRSTIRAQLNQGLDGAIISGSLGTINRIHNELSGIILPGEMGRITGAELREGRNQAKKKALILATPTVDIGYNFERAEPKPRQNIDFLLVDAYSGDEFIQRLGRAGRVLAKEERDHLSTVLAVVDPAAYKLLQVYDGKELERSELGRLATLEEMPKRNDFYAYIKTGAILEIFRPINFLSRGTSDATIPDLEAFFQNLQQLFEVKKPFTLKYAKGITKAFEEREKYYGELTMLPAEVFDMLHLCIEGRPLNIALTAQTEKCLEVFEKRLRNVAPKEIAGKNTREVVRWIQDDLRCYFINKARFSFRDSFQPPLALVYDPHNYHSSKDVAQYNVLHIIKYYEAHFFDTLEKWKQDTQAIAPTDVPNVLTYCQLQGFRDAPLQIGLKLNANEYTQDEWEEQFAYQVTALYGLEVVPLKDHHGFSSSIQTVMHTQFLPAFVALDDYKSATTSELRRLQKRGRFFPMQLEVTFYDGQSRSYSAILGTMAFQVCAEIPYRAIAIDRRKTQLADEAPMIC